MNNSDLLKNSIIELCQEAKNASPSLQNLKTKSKNDLLLELSKNILDNSKQIIGANSLDVDIAKNNGMKASMVDRLILDEARLKGMASDLKKLASLDDPIGKTNKMWINDAGLKIGERVVPLGVIAIIYESRPNVTVDAASLCLKTGNSVVLKGGSDAINSNRELVRVIKESLVKCDLSPNLVQFVDTTNREATSHLMKLNEYIDVIIPRGGASLINFVKNNSSVPIIETGTGNCHIYVDKSANLENAVNIVENAKVQKPGACNAVETVLIHKDELNSLAIPLISRLIKNDVSIAGDEFIEKIVASHTDKFKDIDFSLADESDWKTEYLDFKIAIKVVTSIDEAIAHINKYSTKHSESIITEDYTNSEKFLNEINSSSVYINASTRFTDGNMFGFGAEIGISTQMLHARGPMGLDALTSIKYVIYGNGQIR